jgi:predicted Fe-S protein YdhL (DUF1289 family)
MSARPVDQPGTPLPEPAAASPEQLVRTLPPRPDTPCVAVCSTTFDDICRGCGRTVAEVAHWVSMSAEQKEAVWKRILAEGYPRRNG